MTIGTQTATISIANDDSDENPYTFDVSGLSPPQRLPKRTCSGNTLTIVDGDVTPDVADDTSFPDTNILAMSTRTFTIENNGTADLTLGAFSSSIPFSPFLELRLDRSLPAIQRPLMSSSVQRQSDLRPARSRLSTTTATKSYNFDVSGTGLALVPEVNVQGNLITILDGDVTPSASDHTIFDNTLAGSMSTRTFTIQNSGSSNLSLGAFASTNPLFTIPSPPAGPVAPGGSVTFDVVFSPTAAGTEVSTISFVNDDSDENPYELRRQWIWRVVCTLAVGDIAFSAFSADNTGGAWKEIASSSSPSSRLLRRTVFFTDAWIPSRSHALSVQTEGTCCVRLLSRHCGSHERCSFVSTAGQRLPTPPNELNQPGHVGFRRPTPRSGSSTSR